MLPSLHLQPHVLCKVTQRPAGWRYQMSKWLPARKARSGLYLSLGPTLPYHWLLHQSPPCGVGCVDYITEHLHSPQHKAWRLLLAFRSGDYECLDKERRSLTWTWDWMQALPPHHPLHKQVILCLEPQFFSCEIIMSSISWGSGDMAPLPGFLRWMWSPRWEESLHVRCPVWNLCPMCGALEGVLREGAKSPGPWERLDSEASAGQSRQWFCISTHGVNLWTRALAWDSEDSTLETCDLGKSLPALSLTNFTFKGGREQGCFPGLCYPVIVNSSFSLIHKMWT